VKLCIRNVRLLLENGSVTHGAVLVDSDTGKILKVGKDISPKEADYALNLSGKYLLLPGFVDIHVHCRDFDQCHKETLHTCSEAAAAGGVVKIYDMPNTVPPLNTPDIVKRRIEEASRKCKIIYRLHAGLPEEPEQLYEMYRIGIRSVKLYPDDIEKLIRDEKLARKFFEKVRELNILILAHCEDPEIVRREYEKHEKKVENHNKIRPPEAEVCQVLKIISLALSYGVHRLHIVHVSTPDTVDIINRFRKYLKITCEVTPHHLLLTHEECIERFRETAGICKVNPPLRSSDIRKELLRRLLEGCIDCVASDHAPHSLEEKTRAYDECPPGFPGLETTSLLLLTLWRRGLLELQDVIRLYSWNPSRIVGEPLLRIAEGEDANLVLIDTSRGDKISSQKFRSLAKYSPFDGFEVDISIVLTLCRGKLVYVNDYYTSEISGIDSIMKSLVQ